jgi:hypothetical protein
VSRSISGKDEEWILTNLAFGSASVATAPMNANEDLISGSVRPAESILDGFRDAESGEKKPAFFSERGLKSMRTISYLAGRSRCTVSSPRIGNVEITKATADHITALIRPSVKYWGSVTGSLDVLSVHGKKPRVMVYADFGNVVRCDLDEDLFGNRARDLLGKRATIGGVIHANAIGNVLSIVRDQVFAAPERHNRPVDDFFGKAPDITDGLCVDEYLSLIRGERVEA